MKYLENMTVNELVASQMQIKRLLKEKGVKEKMWSVMIVDSLMDRLKEYKSSIKPRVSMVKLVAMIVDEFLVDKGY